MAEREIAPRCLLCRNHLNSLGVSDKVTPFWNKLSYFNKYPWQKGATGFLMLYMAIAFAVGLINDFISFWILNRLLVFAVLSIGIGYVFKVLITTAKGKFDAPSYDEAIIFDSEGMMGKVIGLFVMLTLIGYFVILPMGVAAIQIYLALVSFSMPAILIILAMEKHVFAAINPARIATCIKAIGWPYLLLFGFSYLIDNGLGFAMSEIHFWLPQAIAYPMLFGAGAYFYIVKFNMFGYVAYQYHNELGYGIDFENLLSSEGEDAPIKRLFSKSDVYIQEGRYEDAESVLYELAQDKRHTVKALERLVRLNIARQNPAGALKAAKNYFDYPELGTIPAEALRLYEDMVGFEPRFKPMNAKARAILVKQMRHKRYADEVKKLCSIPDSMKQDMNLPSLMLARARFESDVMNSDDRALKILDVLLQRYPNGAHQREAEQLRQVCHSMRHKLPSV
ncbi:tetratricopeptide repeat protein [Kangiella sediminilitoris]|nr:hypothetical protein [Kangiella sediminilitoris]